MTVADTHMSFFSLILISIIDRGGIPVALVGGIVLFADESTPTVLLFVVCCSLAGLAGDLLMYSFGVALRKTKSGGNQFLAGPRSLRGRSERVARFIEPAPVAWLLFGRVFAVINQFVPIAAAMLHRPFWEVLWTAALGNACWFGLWAALTLSYGNLSEGWNSTTRIVTLLVGIALALISLKVASGTKLDGIQTQSRDSHE